MPAKKKKGAAAGKAKKKGQQQAVDAARSKAKDQYLADKTFGLKNKKKSKNVQAYIQQTTMAVKGKEMREKAKAAEAKKSKKAAKKAQEDQMKALFGTMTKTVRGKDGKKLTRNEIAAKKKEDEAKEAERKKKAEYWESLTLEEKIEHKRAQLDPAKCTPVTPETFKVWHDAKLAKKKAAEDKRAEELKAAQKGRGKKSMKVSGRELFAINKSLFKDDTAAVDDDDILAMSEPEEEADSEEEDKDDKGFLDSDSDMDDSDDDAPAKSKEAAAPPQKAAKPPAAPTVTATVKGDDGADLAVKLQEDLYLNDDGLDELDDLDDLEEDDE